MRLLDYRTLVPIDRKRFVVGFLVSNVVLAGVLVGMVSAGVATAVPLSGVGTFAIAFDELEGNGFEQRSTLDSSEGCAEYPASVARIDSGTIQGLHLFKDVEMPATGNTVRVSIEADSADFRQLDQQFTHLEGDIAFDGEQTTEYDSSGEVDTMRISASSVTIQNGEITTDSQFISQLSLDELDVELIQNPDDGGLDAPEPTCTSGNSSAA